MRRIFNRLRRSMAALLAVTMVLPSWTVLSLVLAPHAYAAFDPTTGVIGGSGTINGTGTSAILSDITITAGADNDINITDGLVITIADSMESSAQLRFDTNTPVSASTTGSATLANGSPIIVSATQISIPITVSATASDQITVSGISVKSSASGTTASFAKATSLHVNAGAASADSTGIIMVDALNPTLSTVTIASDNASNSKAKVGDNVTLAIVSSEDIATPNVTIAGAAANVSLGADNQHWTATHTMLDTDTTGAVNFSVAYQDMAGNSGTTVSTVTSGANITFDKTAPSIVSAATNSPTTIQLIFSEHLLVSSVTKSDFNVAGNSVYSVDVSANPTIGLTLDTPIGTGDRPAVSIPIGQGVRDDTGNWLNGEVFAPSIIDGIKPVVDNSNPNVASLSYTEGGGTNPETLTIGFSEPIGTVGLIGDYSIFYSSDGTFSLATTRDIDKTNMTTPVLKSDDNAKIVMTIPDQSNLTDAGGKFRVIVGQETKDMAGNSVDQTAIDANRATSDVISSFNTVLPNVYVDQTYTATSAGGHTYGLDAFDNIQSAISAAADNGTVYIAAGNFNGAITVNKNVSLFGTGSSTALKNLLGTAINVSGGTVNISKVKITDSVTGLKVTGGNVTISESEFSGVSVALDVTTGDTIRVNAAKNYWGASTGPTTDQIVAPGNNVTYRPFYTDSVLTTLSQVSVTPNQLASLVSNGTFVPDLTDNGSATSTAKVTVAEQTTISVTDGSTVVLPAGTEISRVDGNKLDATSLSATAVAIDAISGLTSGLVTQGVIQWGLPNIGLKFSTPITLNIFVGTSLNGQLLSVKRSVSGSSDWTSDGIVAPATCTVANGICTFQAYKASFYSTVTELQKPAASVTTLRKDNDRYIKVEWSGVGYGVEQYRVIVNGVSSDQVSPTATDDSGVAYSREIKVLGDGKYDVYVKAVKGQAYSISDTATVEFATPAVSTAAVTTESSNTPQATSIQPQRAYAAEPAQTEQTGQNATQIESTEDDNDGIIKGEENKADENVNWTPWIILFVLIILAGAATGGYFYWFGEEETEAATKPPVRENRPIANKAEVKTTIKKKSAKGKNAKRW